MPAPPPLSEPATVSAMGIAWVREKPSATSHPPLTEPVKESGPNDWRFWRPVPFAGITRIRFLGLTPVASLSPFEHPNGESGDSRSRGAVQPQALAAVRLRLLCRCLDAVRPSGRPPG